MGAIGNLIHNNDAASTAMVAHYMVEVVAQVGYTMSVDFADRILAC